MNNSTNPANSAGNSVCGQKLDYQKLIETAQLLEQFRHALVYLKLCSVGLSSVPAFHGDVDSDQAANALINAFFITLYKTMPPDYAEYGEFGALEEALEDAENILMDAAKLLKRSKSSRR